MVATALIAGAFAFMPIQDAQAVHTTIQGTQLNDVNGSVATNCIVDIDTNELVATSDKDFEIYFHIHADAGATTAVTLLDDNPGGAQTLTIELLDNTGISGVLYFEAGDVITFGDDGTNDATMCATIVTVSGGTATVT